MQFQLSAFVAFFFALSGAKFFFIGVIKFYAHLIYLTLKNDFLTLKLILFTLIQRDKLKWMCVTLNKVVWE